MVSLESSLSACARPRKWRERVSARALILPPGGVRTKTAMHYFDEFPTWRNFVVMRAVFRVSLIIVCTTFAGLFSATILDLESSGIAK